MEYTNNYKVRLQSNRIAFGKLFLAACKTCVAQGELTLTRRKRRFFVCLRCSDVFSNPILFDYKHE